MGSHNDEFPILCETCLGPNPYIRMTKEKYGKACKICDRPFTVYRWKPGPKGRYKKTELCHSCAKMKNVCQTCVFDLQYGLPVQVRDSVLAEHERKAMPVSDVNKAFMLEQEERKLAAGGAQYGKMQKTNPALERMARRTPYYERNRARLCSFFARGECNRGKTCPYRHEMPTTGPLAKQNIKDRYYGQNDPVANKILSRQEKQKELLAPSDQSITTLWVGGLLETHTEGDLQEIFSGYGNPAIRLLSSKQCAFIQFGSRLHAERAATDLYNNLDIRGASLRLRWGRRAAGAAGAPPPPPGMKAMPPPPGMKAPAAGAAAPYYPSMDPRGGGAKLTKD